MRCTKPGREECEEEARVCSWSPPFSDSTRLRGVRLVAGWVDDLVSSLSSSTGSSVRQMGQVLCVPAHHAQLLRQNGAGKSAWCTPSKKNLSSVEGRLPSGRSQPVKSQSRVGCSTLRTQHCRLTEPRHKTVVMEDVLAWQAQD